MFIWNFLILFALPKVYGAEMGEEIYQLGGNECRSAAIDLLQHLPQ
jgi:hypothetical protein